MHDNRYLNLSDHDSFASGVPHETFTQMRKEDPVAWTDGCTETKGSWNLTRHANILMANRDNAIFSWPKVSALKIRVIKSTCLGVLFTKLMRRSIQIFDVSLILTLPNQLLQSLTLSFAN